MALIDRYRGKMAKHLPEMDDDLLLSHHNDAVQSLGQLTTDDKEAIGEVFMDIVDINWKECEEVCRKTLGRVEKRILSAASEDKSESYWSRMKKLDEEYSSCIGKWLRSKMQFMRLEYLDDRQDSDFDILMGDVQKHSTAGSGEEHFEKELKLRMTWGRIIVFWNYWIDCRKETIDVLNRVLAVFRGVELPADERNPVQYFLEMIESHCGFENYPLQFAHIVNKDFSCYKVLHRKLTEFLDLVTSSEYLDAFDVEPKDLFFNISTFQTNISTRQSETSPRFDICENIISQEQDGLGETAKLLACTSRPLLHFKDLLRKLYDEGRLNQAGLEDVINDLQQEETDMSTMFSESLLSFLEVSCQVNDAAEQLRKVIKEWLPRRENSIAKMKEIIEKLNKTTKDVAIAQTVSSSVGIVGGAVTVGCILLAPFTFGTSLIVGGAISGVGVAAAIGANIAEIVIDKGDMEKANQCIEEDKVLFKEVAKEIENLNHLSTMLLRYIPQDELESLISVMTDPQSNAMLSISSRSQIDPRIAAKVARLIGIDGKAIVTPVSRLVVAGVVFASKMGVLTVFRGFFVLGAIFDIYNVVQASVKLSKGAKSEHAGKLEEVVEKMENERIMMKNCLAEMS